ncbi:MAG: heparinase II/III family protein [Hyphomicrobiales bacterium]
MTGRGKSVDFEAWRSLAAALYAAGDSLAARLAAAPVSAPRFTGLSRPLPYLDRGHPELAQDLYRGHFAFARQVLDCSPNDVFRVPGPDSAWAAELAGFAWLAHLEAAASALYRSFARAMVLAWADHGKNRDRHCDCTRLISFARHAGFLLTGATAEFERRFLAIASREARRLQRRRALTDCEALRQWAALLSAAFAFRGGETLRAQALHGLAAAVQASILPDGGPASRNPQDLLALLLDVIPLRDMLAGQRLAIPPALAASIDRALPMLRMLCHGDGGLALFQGADGTCKTAVRAVLEHDSVAGQPLVHAPHSGYCRLAQGEAVVIADCGPASACNGELAFEFSDGPHRIVGNCGMPRHAKPAWREAAKSPAAHSTLDHSGVRGTPEADVTVSSHGLLISARSPCHERDLYLAAIGQDFRGEDRVVSPSSGFVLRFHLHPSVRAWQDRKGANILLLLPNQAAWKFTARGGRVSLEDSLFLATGAGPRDCRQIVIRGESQGASRVNWAFKKLDRKSRPRRSADASPQLPF